MRKARVVFDLDGTLIDSAPDIRAVANIILNQKGLEPLSLAQTRQFIGNGVGVFVEKMSALRAIPEAEHARLVTDFLTEYETAVHQTTVFPKVREALDQLKSDGHHLGICTNKPYAPTLAVLRHLDLTQYFEVVVGGDSYAERKPDPMPLHAAFDGLPEGEHVFVGDSDVDAATAKNAETAFFLYTHGYCKVPLESLYSTSVFDDFAQLPALVDAQTR